MSNKRFRRSRVMWVRGLSHASIVMMNGKYRRRFKDGLLTDREETMWSEIWKELQFRVDSESEYQTCRHVACLDVMWDAPMAGFTEDRRTPWSPEECNDVPDELWGLIHAEEVQLPFPEV